MLARPGTYAGSHGRTQMTVNNSLFGLQLAAPEWRGMQAIGHVEVDFFGVQPTDATEQTIYTTPALRMRLFYLRLKKSMGPRASTCSPASTTICSPGAAPASTRTASRSSASRARSITASRRSG